MPLALPARGRAIPDGAHVRARRPVLLPPDARRARRPPRLGGPARAAVREARRARARGRRRARARRSRSGRRTRARSASSATSTAGTAACTRCARSARPGIWELFLPGVERRRALQVRAPPARTARSTSGPTRSRSRPRTPPQTASVVFTCAPRRGRTASGSSSARDVRPAGASRSRSTRCTSARGGQGLTLPRARRAARRLRRATSASRTSSCCR